MAKNQSDSFNFIYVMIKHEINVENEISKKKIKQNSKKICEVLLLDQ